MNPFNMGLDNNPMNDPDHITELNTRILWPNPNDEPSDDADFLRRVAIEQQARFESDNLLPVLPFELAEKRATIMENARLLYLAEKAIKLQFKGKLNLRGFS